MGKAFIPSGDQSVAYARLADQLREIGLYIVEVGELEQFCKLVPDHGPSWVVNVLKRDLTNDPELEAARQFAKLLLTGWERG